MRSKVLRLVDAPDLHVPGWASIRRELVLGRGRRVFEQAVRRIRSGRMHASLGIGFQRRRGGGGGPDMVRLSILGLPNWCEVMEESLTGQEYVFVYRAGRRHLLRGDEAFVVRRDDAGTVTAVVAAVSRPVFAPLNRLQGWAASGYLRGMRPRGRRKAGCPWRK